MKARKLYGNWRKETIERAISILRLIRITQAAREVELHSPPKECPECHEMVEVVVLPAEMCGTCWSRKVIGAWQILPVEFATVTSGGGTSRLRRRR